MGKETNKDKQIKPTTKIAVPTEFLATVGECRDGYAFNLKRSMLLVPENADKLVDQIRKLATQAAAGNDTTTTRGREQIASAAYRVARSKTWLTGVFKQAYEAAMVGPKAIKSQQARIEQALDALRAEIRLPLTQWEIADAERRNAEFLAAQAAAAPTNPPPAPATSTPVGKVSSSPKGGKVDETALIDETVNALINKLGLSKAAANKLVTAIRSGEIPHLNWVP